MSFETFFHQYLETAVWASTGYWPGDEDDNGNPPCLEEHGFTGDEDDFDAESLEKLREEAHDFWEANPECHEDPGQAGHDFWLTRNGHGAGFWDGDWDAEIGRKLTDASHVYGSCDLYIGDDEKLHVY